MSNETENEGVAKSIAKMILRIEELETRNSDSLDFHDLAVWEIKQALELAFEMGKLSTNTK